MLEEEDTRQLWDTHRCLEREVVELWLCFQWLIPEGMNSCELVPQHRPLKTHEGRNTSASGKLCPYCCVEGRTKTINVELCSALHCQNDDLCIRQHTQRFCTHLETVVALGVCRVVEKQVLQTKQAKYLTI